METEKETLLREIERLLSFDGSPTEINPDYLAYFTIEELTRIRDDLQNKIDRMVEENREWMRRFKKEDASAKEEARTADKDEHPDGKIENH